MKYKAIQEIGGYRIGEEVPAEKAEAWMKMYRVSPVEKIEDKEKSVPEEVKHSEPEEIKPSEVLEEEIEETLENPMSDDYLNRSTKVVKKSIDRDKLSKKQLQEILGIEKSQKKRSQIIDAIEKKLKNLGE
jgi:alpha-galactosidase/6-phospho-beta-glucosidase family protein